VDFAHLPLSEVGHQLLVVVNVKSSFRNFVNFLLAYFAYLRYTIFKGGGTYDSRRKNQENPHISGYDAKGIGAGYRL
jgi:hypothetical protein